MDNQAAAERTVAEVWSLRPDLQGSACTATRLVELLDVVTEELFGRVDDPAQISLAAIERLLEESGVRDRRLLFSVHNAFVG